MNFGHALRKVHTIMLSLGHTDVCAGGERKFFGFDFFQCRNLAQTGNIVISSVLAEFFS